MWISTGQVDLLPLHLPTLPSSDHSFGQIICPLFKSTPLHPSLKFVEISSCPPLIFLLISVVDVCHLLFSAVVFSKVLAEREINTSSPS